MGPETSLQYEGVVRFRHGARTESRLRQQRPRQHPEAGVDPAAGRGRVTLGGQPITSQNANGAVFVPVSTIPVLVRANFDNARIWGIEHSLDAQTPSRRLASHGVHLPARQGPGHEPVAQHRRGHAGAAALVGVRYAPQGRSWWVEPYGNIAAKQTHLSSLDLGDRRTGSGRTRASIQAFFRNGARNRGWVAPARTACSTTPTTF